MERKRNIKDLVTKEVGVKPLPIPNIDMKSVAESKAIVSLKKVGFEGKEVADKAIKKLEKMVYEFVKLMGNGFTSIKEYCEPKGKRRLVVFNDMEQFTDICDYIKYCEEEGIDLGLDKCKNIQEKFNSLLSDFGYDNLDNNMEVKGENKWTGVSNKEIVDFVFGSDDKPLTTERVGRIMLAVKGSEE